MEQKLYKNLFQLFFFFIAVLYPQKKMDIDDLIIRENIIFEAGEEKPFTGKVFKYFSDSENMQLEGNIKNGLFHGKWTWWDSTGIKMASGTFKNGFQDGKWTWWYINGKKAEIGSYKDGKKSGVWTNWYRSGEKLYKGSYRNGELVGEETYYSKDGKAKEPINEDALIFRNEKAYEVNQDEPFTGYIFVNWNEHQILKSYRNGRVSDEWIFLLENGIKYKGKFIREKDLDGLLAAISSGVDTVNVSGDYLVFSRKGYGYDYNIHPEYYKIDSHRSYINGNRDSEWTYFFEDGSDYKKEYYSLGKMEGIWTWWFKNRQIKKIESYKDNYKYGEWSTWYENGQKESEIFFINGILNGSWNVWYENGQNAKAGNYKDGLKTGKWIVKSENGVVRGQGTFTKGTGKWIEWSYSYEGEKYKSKEENYTADSLDGAWTEWDEKGRKIKDGTYKMGKKEGKWTWSDYYGKVEGHYVNDELNGLYTKWDDDGNKESAAYYKNGMLDGLFITWYSNGNKKVEGHYSIGNFESAGQISFKTGKWTYWHESGSKWREDIYSTELVYTRKREGAPEGIWTYWDKEGHEYKGEVRKDTSKEKSDGSFFIFDDYDDRKLEMHGTFKNEKPNGSWTIWSTWNRNYKRYQRTYTDGVYDGEIKEWFSNGQLNIRGNYKNGKKFGQWTYWYENSQKEKEGNYTVDKLKWGGSWIDKAFKKGKWIYWYENGQKRSEGEHDLWEWEGNDLLTGYWTYWYENGNKRAEGEYSGIYIAHQFYAPHYGSDHTGHQKIGEWKYYREDGSVKKVKMEKGSK